MAGYNLLEPLADYDQVIWQGINGPVYALLALDSREYEIPAAPEGKTQTTREKLIDYILEKEIASGGWALFGSSADPDITAMTIQALAAYYGTDSRVTAVSGPGCCPPFRHAEGGRRLCQLGIGQQRILRPGRGGAGGPGD